MQVLYVYKTEQSKEVCLIMFDMCYYHTLWNVHMSHTQIVINQGESSCLTCGRFQNIHFFTNVYQRFTSFCDVSTYNQLYEKCSTQNLHHFGVKMIVLCQVLSEISAVLV